MQTEDLAFAFLNPTAYQKIKTDVESYFPHREQYMKALKQQLCQRLEAAKISAEVQARAKTIYSIYKKQKDRKVLLRNIFDLVGFRVITKTKDECYQVLNLIQDIGSLFQGEGVLVESIRDYIESPKKSTGYQSIHLNICYGTPPRIVEFQIRTEAMHLAAEGALAEFGLGKAAHWHYKTYARPSSKKNYHKANEKTSLNITIECELDSVIRVGHIILGNSKFEILNVDVDRSLDERIILRLVLKPKSGSKNQPDISQETIRLEVISLLNEKIKKENIKNCYVLNSQQESEIREEGLSVEKKEALLRSLSSQASDLGNFIYVFTPKGEMKKLPKGATPVDFAYVIHTDVGNHCCGAKVNEAKVALDRPLNNGDRVQIMLDKHSHPKRDWLKFVQKKAENCIKKWYKKSEHRQNIEAGKARLARELEKHGIAALINQAETMKTVAEQCNFSSVENLYAHLGYYSQDKPGVISLNKIVNLLLREIASVPSSSPQDSRFVPSGLTSTEISPIVAKQDRISYQIAQCCKPIPFEDCIALVKRVQPVQKHQPANSTRSMNPNFLIHSADCPNLKDAFSDRKFPVTWPLDVKIKVLDRTGILRDILDYCKICDINTRKAYGNSSQGFSESGLEKLALIDLTIDIRDRLQAKYILKQIRNMPEVKSVQCLTSGIE
jgi:(p)ppGpp synthase/HD superfamily hydrolase